jgi:acetyl-CoA carboxylase carboxyl transferase subunit beta
VSTIILGASVVVVADGAILLVQRGHEPQLGRWSVPGGRVEPGETLRQAATREAYEETGLEVRVGRELWSLLIPDGDRTFEVHDFAATVTGGTLRAGDDAADVRWIPFEELEDLPLTDGLMGYLKPGSSSSSRRRPDTTSGGVSTPLGFRGSGPVTRRRGTGKGWPSQ